MYTPSTFLTLLKPLNRFRFQTIVDKHQGDKGSKGFSCWNQLIVMLFAQLTKQESLRSTIYHFNEHLQLHYHLHSTSVQRSTLSYANAHRSYEIYQEVASDLVKHCTRHIKSEAQSLLKIMDATYLRFDKGTTHDLVKSNGNVYGVKLHLEYDATHKLPTYYAITPANVNDIVIAKTLPIQAGATYVMDKGYMNFEWWQNLQKKGCRFVSRMQKSVRYEVVKTQACANDASIVEDHIIRLTGPHTRKKYVDCLRQLVIQLTPEKRITLISNDLTSEAAGLAALYKRRWEIELLFKWIKQNLRIKQFMFKDPNAILIQILTALIAYLLIAFYRNLSGASFSLRETLLEVRLYLLVNKDHKKQHQQRIKQKQSLENQYSLCF